jgi:hypothetical protein
VFTAYGGAHTLIPALGRPKQEDHHVQAGLYRETLYQKKKRKTPPKTNQTKPSLYMSFVTSITNDDTVTQ